MQTFLLDDFLPFRMNRASELIAQRFAASYKARFGLTRPEWRTLAALGSCGRLNATEIGRHSTMHKTKVSRAIFALEQRRWLKRIRSDEDRRVELIELTPLGQRAYGELAVLAEAYGEELNRLLGTDGVKAIDKGLAAIETCFVGKETRSG
nr:MarR family transcriptional regulator [uncultured Gellertiella sp.]